MPDDGQVYCGVQNQQSQTLVLPRPSLLYYSGKTSIPPRRDEDFLKAKPLWAKQLKANSFALNRFAFDRSVAAVAALRILQG